MLNGTLRATAMQGALAGDDGMNAGLIVNGIGVPQIFNGAVASATFFGLAYLTTSPVEGGSDFTDARYYFVSAYSKQEYVGGGAGDPDPLALITPDTSGCLRYYGSATNLAEIKIDNMASGPPYTVDKGTHKLRPGTVVSLWLLHHDQTRGPEGVEPVPQFVFFREVASESVTVKFISVCTGKGKYNGKTFAPKDFTAVDSSSFAASDLGESDFGTLAAETDCIICVPQELAVSNTGHDILQTANTNHYAAYGEGPVRGVTKDGLKVVHVNYLWSGCE